jgi:hypothetical protein
MGSQTVRALATHSNGRPAPLFLSPAVHHCPDGTGNVVDACFMKDSPGVRLVKSYARALDTDEKRRGLVAVSR